MDVIGNKRAVDVDVDDVSAGIEMEGEGPSRLQVLPELALEAIIRELEEPKDVYNLLEAYPWIDEVLGVSKSCKLLFDKVFPLLFKDLNKKDILNCREVFRWWKTSVDNFIEGHPSQQPYDSKTFYEVETGYRYSDLKSKGMKVVVIRHPDGFYEKVQYAQEQRELGLKIPSFIGKSVQFLQNQHQPPPLYTLNFANYDGFKIPLKNYYKDLEKFLLNYGSEIWHANIPLTGEKYYDYRYVDHYESFLRCLQLLSQVKTLIVNFYCKVILTSRTDSIPSKLEVKKKLDSYMSLFPLPDMPNLNALTLISFHGDRIVPLDEIFVALLKKFSRQIRRLSLNLDLWKKEHGLDFENLVELKLFKFGNGRDDDVTLKERITDVETPKLEKLILLFASTFLTTTTMREIFEACESLPVKVLNICRLSLEIQDDDGNDINDMFLPSPTEALPVLINVTAFVLKFHHILSNGSFSFLKSLPMLEYLEIKKTLKYEEEDEDEVGVGDGEVDEGEEGEDGGAEEISENELLDADGLQVGPNGEKMGVWELLPKLKMFVVGDKRLPRELYNKKLN